NTIQNDLVFNDTLYNSQTQFGAVSNALYDDDNKNNYENNDIVDYEGDWNYVMKEVKKYRSKRGFNICCYHVERSNSTIQRRTLVCEYYGQPEATKSKNPKKVTISKHVGYTWHINLSYPEKNNSHKVVYITKLIDEHKNHELDKAHYDF
ncbi:42117_t:CDS:2, partial [Gigaspora margarita]